MAEEFDLTGKTALVTGASQGLGRRFAEVLAAHGAAVALAARQTDKLAALAGDIQARGGRATVPLDVTDCAAIETVAKAEDAFALDILVNNAGVAVTRRFLEVTPEVDRVLDAIAWLFFSPKASPSGWSRAAVGRSSISPRSLAKMSSARYRPIARPRPVFCISPGRWRWNWPKPGCASTPSRRAISKPR